jgi:peptidyl-prolyl cis-trans isomerase C
MRKTPIALLIGALIGVAPAFAEEAKNAPAATPGPETTIATVNGVAYPLDLFRIFYVERLQETKTQNTPEFQQQAFNEFMSLIVASQEAEKRKLEDNQEVKSAIQLQRMKVLSNAALASFAQDIKVSDDDLKKAYEQVKAGASRTEYKARHILVKDEAEAKKVIKELDKKADFADLAKKYSLGPNAKDGGDLGWLDASQMVKPFADAVANLKPGTYTKEPVQTQFGWHVILLEDTRKAEPPSFDDAKPQLTAMVQRQKIAEQLAHLRDTAMVELNEQVVKVKPKEEAAAETGKGESAPAKKDNGKKDSGKK